MPIVLVFQAYPNRHFNNVTLCVPGGQVLRIRLPEGPLEGRPQAGVRQSLGGEDLGLDLDLGLGLLAGARAGGPSASRPAAMPTGCGGLGVSGLRP